MRHTHTHSSIMFVAWLTVSGMLPDRLLLCSNLKQRDGSCQMAGLSTGTGQSGGRTVGPIQASSSVPAGCSQTGGSAKVGWFGHTRVAVVRSAVVPSLRAELLLVGGKRVATLLYPH